MSDLKGVPRKIIATADRDCYPDALVAYADLIVRNGIVVKDRHGTVGRDAYPDEIATCRELTPADARVLIDAAAWRGEAPAEGTRRALIFNTIRRPDVLSDAEALDFADEIELALQTAMPYGTAADRLADVRTFAAAQRDSHQGLRESDPSYAEYHRGAKVAYEIVADRLDPDLPGKLRDNPHLTDEQRAKIEDQLRYAVKAKPVHLTYTTDDPEAWKGTPPAEGTRRALIRDTIERTFAGKVFPTDFDGYNELYLEIADAVESALLRGEGAPIKHPTLARIDKELCVQRRALAECYRLTGADPSDGSDAMLAREAVDEVRRFRAEYDELEERLERAEGQLKAGRVPVDTKELHIVLGQNPDSDSPELLFVELEDQDGRGVGGFVTKDDGQYRRIVIPYGRDDKWVQEVVMAAITAGQEAVNPFPAEAVDAVLRAFGIRPTLPRSWPLRGEAAISKHDSAETADDSGGESPEEDLSPAARQQLEDEIEHLSFGREEARLGEDHWKAQRDAALRLLLWVIGDLLPVEKR